MALDYSNSGYNSSFSGLASLLLPTKNWAAESAIEDRRTQFLALQANQSRIDQQENAKAIAEYDAKISAIQQIPFIGQDKKNITKWLDEYQQKVKDKVKSEYSSNPADFIQAEGAFLSSKIQKEFMSSDVYRQGEERRVAAGLAMEAIKKGDKLIGETSQDGSYKTGDQRINDYFNGISSDYSFRGSYKADPNKAFEYFAKQPAPITAESFLRDKKGNPILKNGNPVLDPNFNPHTGFKVPEKISEQFMLNELGSQEALNDFKARNPRFFKDLSYSNNQDDALKYAQSISDQNIQENTAAMNKGKYLMTVDEHGKNMELKALDKKLKEKKLEGGDPADVTSLFKYGNKIKLPIINMNRELSGREGLLNGKVSNLSDDGGKSIDFEPITNQSVYELEGTVFTPQKSKSGQSIGYKFLDGKTNIILPQIGDVPLKNDEYFVEDFSTNGLLRDKSNKYWTRGVISISEKGLAKIDKKYHSLLGVKEVTEIDPKKPNERIAARRYTSDFYAPIDFKDQGLKKLRASSTSSDSQYENAGRETNLGVDYNIDNSNY